MSANRRLGDLKAALDKLRADAEAMQGDMASTAMAINTLREQILGAREDALAVATAATALGTRLRTHSDHASALVGLVNLQAADVQAIGNRLRDQAAQVELIRATIPYQREAPFDRPDPAIWREAPSGLPFWLGGFRGLDEIARLLSGTMAENGGKLDLVLDYDIATNTQAESPAITIKSWRNSPSYRHLSAKKTYAFCWTAHPFNGGGAYRAPASWPEDLGKTDFSLFPLCPNKPPTYSGAETAEEKREKQLRVWQYAADGWLDAAWRLRLQAMKRDFFNPLGWHERVLVMRAAHELDLYPQWGGTSSPRCNSIAYLTTAADMGVVKEALRRFFNEFLSVFGQVQTEIAGDVSYPVDNLWTYVNPIKESFMPRAADILSAIPNNAYIVGPDVYDHYPASMNAAEFGANAVRHVIPAENATKPRWHRGLQVWLDWCRVNGRLLALGEFGVWSETFASDGVSRPSHEGWDNQAFVTGILDWLTRNAEDVAFASWFNVDVAKPDEPRGNEMPGHRIDWWEGIDDPAVPCERTPLGDNNRCAARAFRRWAQSFTSPVG